MARKYDSSGRRAQAERNRLRMLEAAQRLFERDGYVATTMEAVAAESGFALKTVYAAFATKAGLLRSVWDLALKGDTDDAPVAARAWYREVLEHEDPQAQAELIVRSSVAVKRRIGRLLRAIRSAAEVDPDGAALWALIQTDFHANQAALVAAIDRNGGLRPGLDTATAADVLWTLNHPDTWLLLVGERGWTPEASEAWFLDAIRSLVVGQAGGARRSSSRGARRRGRGSEAGAQGEVPGGAGQAPAP